MENKYWTIKQNLEGRDNLKEILALVIMMEVGIRDDIFKNYTDSNPEFYNWFEIKDESRESINPSLDTK